MENFDHDTKYYDYQIYKIANSYNECYVASSKNGIGNETIKIFSQFKKYKNGNGKYRKVFQVLKSGSITISEIEKGTATISTIKERRDKFILEFDNVRNI